jgi:hypothetical protein
VGESCDSRPSLGVDGHPDAGQQHVRAKGLLDQDDAVLEAALIGDGLLSVARHHEDLHRGPQRGDAGCQVGAVSAGHDHVGKQKVDRTRVLGGDRLSRSGPLGGEEPG